MTSSFMLLVLVAVFANPTPAQACACEIAWDETVTATWQQGQTDEESKSRIVAPGLPGPKTEAVTVIEPIETPAIVEEPITEPKHYAVMQEIHVGIDGITNVTMGEATPDFLIHRALNEKGIQNEWLVPLSCPELDRVEDALYARHEVDFEDPADEAFFASVTTGTYRPVPNLTREEVGRLLFSSQDKLTQLRVDRAQANANCSN